MRYPVGEQPVTRDALHSSDGMHAATAVYGFIIGIGFVAVGIKAKQRWLSFRGAGLSLASLFMSF